MIPYLQLIPSLYLMYNIFYTFTQFQLTPISIGIITYLPFNLLYYTSFSKVLPISDKILNLLDISFQYVMVFIWSTGLKYFIFRTICYVLTIYYISLYLYLDNPPQVELVKYIDLHYVTLFSILLIFNFDIMLQNGLIEMIPVLLPIVGGIFSYLSNLKYKYLILNICQVCFYRQLFFLDDKNRK